MVARECPSDPIVAIYSKSSGLIRGQDCRVHRRETRSSLPLLVDSKSWNPTPSDASGRAYRRHT